MRVLKPFVLVFLVSSFFVKCANEGNRSTVNEKDEMTDIDVQSMHVIRTFALSNSEHMKFDSSSLVFYCSRAYDTSSLLELEIQKNLIRGVYYVILPEYHRFLTDYADTSSKLIFFEGYSFTIDSAVWISVTNQAKIILQKKEELSKGEKYTDGATYALYYNNQSSHGNSNNETAYENFDKFLKDSFLGRFMQARKPIMHKVK
jgi:hypothetical protein